MEHLENEHAILKQSSIHNMGVFAKAEITPGTKVIEYIGEKISKEEGTRRSDATEALAKTRHDIGSTYIFELNDEWDIDGDVPGNLAKYINHSCEPNCNIMFDDNKIYIVANKEIKAGEELTYNYGFDEEDYQDHPCRCNSPNCVGYILGQEHWHILKNEKGLKHEARESGIMVEIRN
ncbi:SET domain-containing protein-lysine N-methyltransferase [Candidatus Woesearchaeota archaeon]|nr:SET domain-containing protein-lysine N-methyltransferase [Candidatus Woesearchaeota archaeon]